MMSDTESNDSESVNAEQFPTTAIPDSDTPRAPSTVMGDEQTKQQRLVGNVFVGQVLVNWDGYEYDADKTNYEQYTGHTWEIVDISEDSQFLTLQKRDGDDAGRERHIPVAELAREHIEDGSWMFLKDTMKAVTWSGHGPSNRCLNCGVTRDNGLSREKHFEAEMGGREWKMTLRRCVGCHNYGTVGMSVDHSATRQNKFTTGVLEGQDPPLGQV